MVDEFPKLKQNQGTVDLVEGEFVKPETHKEPETVADLDRLVDLWKRESLGKEMKMVPMKKADHSFKDYFTVENIQGAVGVALITGLAVNTIYQVGLYIKELIN